MGSDSSSRLTCRDEGSRGRPIARIGPRRRSCCSAMDCARCFSWTLTTVGPLMPATCSVLETTWAPTPCRCLTAALRERCVTSWTVARRAGFWTPNGSRSQPSPSHYHLPDEGYGMTTLSCPLDCSLVSRLALASTVPRTSFPRVGLRVPCQRSSCCVYISCLFRLMIFWAVWTPPRVCRSRTRPHLTYSRRYFVSCGVVLWGV